MSIASSKLGWPRKRSDGEDRSGATGLGWAASSASLAANVASGRRDGVSRETLSPVSEESAGAPRVGGDSANEAPSSQHAVVPCETDASVADEPIAESGMDGPVGSPTSPAGEAVSRETSTEPSRESPRATGSDGPGAAEPARPETDVPGVSQLAPAVHQPSAGAADEARNPAEPPSPAVADETHRTEVVEGADGRAVRAEPEPSAVSTSPAPVSRETPVVEPIPRPAQTRVVTISNQKGGVGKTTTTVNLAAALAMGGARVLVIDLDPQGNASTGMGIAHPQGTPSSYDVIIDRMPLAEAAQQVEAAGVPAGQLYCVPATSDLAGAEVELAGVMVGREFRLKSAISDYLAAHEADQPFDYVLIDCPPSLGLLTVNALAGAAEVLIPVQCEYYALEGLGQLLETVELIKGYLNPTLRVSTMLLTMFDARTKLAGQVVDEVREHFGETVMRAIIPRSVKVSEAPSYAMSVLSYDPESRGAVAYATAAREFAARG